MPYRPFTTLPPASSSVALVIVTGALLGDSSPPTGVEVAVIVPSGKLFVGLIVAIPWVLATASPIKTSLESYNFTVDPACAFTVTTAAVLAFPAKLFSITGATPVWA